ncbi:MAG: tyrosine-type recombinase/integrase [Alphaproteobacteria bacterium]|nr:tyrosine-type recombinase/integrase [Reyranella sp.]MBL6940072.1 tyrosine-type recombinase/integrase [Alphaproteobacteria bacterium]MBL7100159.1 tyrosine-type recombinase/integrase [Alphaproteobacteria bacterium]
MTKALVVITSSSAAVLPALIADAGDQTAKHFLEFFAATIRNKNTREAYYRACCRFFAWCEDPRTGIASLADIEPIHVAAHVEALMKDYEKPTVKQHLAAIRMCFDYLVTKGAIATNPAHAVRGPKHSVKRGKTPVLSSGDARDVLDSIDTSTLIGLRDRALIAVMTYTFARVSAVIKMKGEDYFHSDDQWRLRLHEKGGKLHEVPAHLKLKQYLDEYIAAAGIARDKKSPLFRSARGKTGELTSKAMARQDVFRMIGRRAPELRKRSKIGCHTFRATGLTAFLNNGGRLEDAQAIAAHESLRTTQLYDRRDDEITLAQVSKIKI